MRSRIILFLFCFSFLASAQSLDKKIDELVSKYTSYKLFNGTVLVADESGVVFKKGYGYANMEWKIPNEPDVKFRLGSITKQFTAMVIMQLVQEGKIKVDDHLSDYLDYYRKDTGEKITIHHLLTHTSGIPSYTADPDFFAVTSRKFYKPDDFVKEYCMGNLEFDPGSKFTYNNSGYFILGAIIEKITGKSYKKNLEERIFIPLGMSASGYDMADPLIEKRASGYERAAAEYVNAGFLDMSLPYAAGSIYSTVEDLYKWDRALYTNKLLKDEFKEQYFKPYVEAMGGNYSYGWFVYKNKTWDKDRELTVITHGGGINGFNTSLARVTDDKKLIVLLNNTGGTVLNEISNSILNILYGLPYPEPKIPVSSHLREIAAAEGIDKAVDEYKRISREEKESYDLKEQELNNLGYYYLREGKVKEALAVFYLNIEAFPDAYNVYDSYGEALMADGQNEKAIENYKKSLELNSRNKNAVTQLAALGVKIEEKKDAVVPVEILKTYEGKYEIKPDFIITVTTENEKIFAQATGQPKFEIFPETETRFYLKAVDAQMEFEKESDGSVKGLVLYQGGQKISSPKID